MSGTQISKIQLRRGLQSDLPGLNGNGLDVAEPAFTTDTGRLFIGSDPSNTPLINLVHGYQNQAGGGFPYGNIEVLTEFSPVNQTIFDNAAKNITTGFLVSVPMVITDPNSWATLTIQQIINNSGSSGSVVQTPFILNAQNPIGLFATAKISYYIIDYNTGVPMRTGTMTIIHQGNAFQPTLVDDAVTNPYAGFATGGSPLDPNAVYGNIGFRVVPALTGTSIQYQINITGILPQPIMYFRVEQPYTQSPLPIPPASNTISTIIVNVNEGGAGGNTVYAAAAGIANIALSVANGVVTESLGYIPLNENTVNNTVTIDFSGDLSGNGVIDIII